MNSAPISTGVAIPGSRSVQQRPPTRSRASSMSTERPARPSSAAAQRPAAPAPMTTASYAGLLLLLDTRVRCDLAPDADFLLDLRGELLRRTARRRDAVALQLISGVLELERLRRFGADSVHDGARQALWSDEAVPEDHIVTGHAGLCDRRHIRQRRDALRGRHGDRAQLARLDVRQRGGRAAEEHIGLAGD